jgi:hypothetical protein
MVYARGDDGVRVWGMRPGIVVEVTAADRDRLNAIVADRPLAGALRGRGRRRPSIRLGACELAV